MALEILAFGLSKPFCHIKAKPLTCAHRDGGAQVSFASCAAFVGAFFRATQILLRVLARKHGYFVRFLGGACCQGVSVDRALTRRMRDFVFVWRFWTGRASRRAGLLFLIVLCRQLHCVGSGYKFGTGWCVPLAHICWKHFFAAAVNCVCVCVESREGLLSRLLVPSSLLAIFSTQKSNALRRQGCVGTKPARIRTTRRWRPRPFHPALIIPPCSLITPPCRKIEQR